MSVSTTISISGDYNISGSDHVIEVIEFGMFELQGQSYINCIALKAKLQGLRWKFVTDESVT